MNTLLLALLLLQNSVPNTATVTGTVRGTNGEPAFGVRVYAVALRDFAAQTAETVPALDGLTETDSAGRFMLQVAAGRYYIAAGSVAVPTYYPGTPNITAAHALNLSANGIVEGIDFSNFITAFRTPESPFLTIPALPPGSTGVLSGVIRFPDGKPAVGQQVTAVPASAMASRFPPAIRGILLQAAADNNGRFRIENVPPDVYYIAAGYSETPTLYPGVADIQNASTIATTPATKLDNLDFTVMPPPPRFTVSGRVIGAAGAPAANVMVRIGRVAEAPSPIAALRLRPATSYEPITVGVDGEFEFSGVVPGTYSLQTLYTKLAEPVTVVVSNRPVRADLSIPVATLSGRVLTADGSPLTNPQIFDEVVVPIVDTPLRTTINLPIDSNGAFGRYLDAGEYRFFLQTLPEEYVISSITAGAVNLLNESIKVSGTEAIQVEIRVARKSTVSGPPGLSVSGKIRDSISGTPTASGRVELCCLETEVSQKLSTPLRSDGTFLFTAVPSGHYSIALKPGSGQPDLYIVPSTVDVAEVSVSDLNLATTTQLGLLTARIVFEDGSPVPATFRTSVVFTGASGRTKVVAERADDGTQYASLPIGDRYAISLIDLPDGETVNSIVGSTDVRPANYPAIGAPPASVPIVITIGASPSPR